MNIFTRSINFFTVQDTMIECIAISASTTYMRKSLRLFTCQKVLLVCTSVDLSFRIGSVMNVDYV